MIYRDEIRILAEMQTFTQRDFAAAVECSPQWASQVFEQLVRGKYIQRVRVGHYWLYALTERGTRFVANMPAVDPDERCLMLEYIAEPARGMYVPECPNCKVGGDWCIWRGNDGAYGVWECLGCHELNRWIDAYDDIPF